MYNQKEEVKRVNGSRMQVAYVRVMPVAYAKVVQRVMPVAYVKVMPGDYRKAEYQMCLPYWSRKEQYRMT